MMFELQFLNLLSHGLYDINNTYIAINAEILIHQLGAKNAFDRKEFYYTGVSYDINKVVRLINDELVTPEIIVPMSTETQEPIW